MFSGLLFRIFLKSKFSLEPSEIEFKKWKKLKNIDAKLQQYFFTISQNINERLHNPLD